MTTISDPLLLAALRTRTASTQPHVVLVYDLHGAPPVVYARLDIELTKLQYTKVYQDTTWEAVYQAGVDQDAALATTKHEFADCARRAGATRYDLRVYGAAARMKIVTDSK